MFQTLQIRWASLAHLLLSFLRIALGGVMLQYGMMKLFAYPQSATHGATLSHLLLASAYIEFIGGLCLIVGVLTRAMAFLMSGEMAFAYFIWHAPKGHWPVLNGGNLPIILCFGLLFLSSAGGGSLGVDAWRRRPSSSADDLAPLIPYFW
jgi:putative oxidoreductase